MYLWTETRPLQVFIFYILRHHEHGRGFFSRPFFYRPMKILTVVKATGYNFIRHYLPFFPYPSRVVHNDEDAFKLMPKFDIILFEWANDLTANIVNTERYRQLQKQHGFKTVVRIHDHEVTKLYSYGRRIDQINWGRVDRIWFINPLIQKQFHELKGDHKSFFLPNAIDHLTFSENQSNAKRVGLVSLYFRERKAIHRVADIARLLPDWEFCIRAEIPGSVSGEFHEQFQELRRKASDLDNIILEDRRVDKVVRAHYENRDLNDWYQNKAVILSTSKHEGFHYAICEGMAAGCMPVVWNWPGSESFWSPYVVQDAEQAAEAISNYQPSGKYRKWVVDHYGGEKLTGELIQQL